MFSAHLALDPKEQFEVSCYKCLGCLHARSTAWAVKASCEISMHPQNCMLTITYDRANLPKGNTLRYRHVQLFLKSLRKHVWKTEGHCIRYLVCGEYGSNATKRPHYHMIIFNWEPDDLTFHHYSKGAQKFPMYESETVYRFWKKGDVFLNEANFETAKYLAKYVTKDHYAKIADDRYRNKEKPFVHSSTKPAIGIPFLEKWTSDIFPHDEVIINGRGYQAPLTFLNWLKKTDPLMFEHVKEQRIRKGKEQRSRSPEEFEHKRQQAKEDYMEYVANRHDANKRL